MEPLSNVALFFKWMKDQLKYIGLFLVFALILVVTAAQYQTLSDPIWYSIIMCSFIGFVSFCYGYFKYQYNYKMLYEAICNKETVLEQLVIPTNFMETCYVELIRELIESRSRLYSEMKKQESEHSDYYTLWIHQIKTPIAAMQLLLQAEETASNNRLLKQELFKIEQYAEMAIYYLRIQNMSSDLLLKHCNLQNIVKQSVKKYSINFIEKKLYLNFEEFDGTVISDEKWLSFIVEQILSNCIKYTQKGGVTIAYCPGEKKFSSNNVRLSKSTLCISDTGIGIKEEDLPRIFEKGFTGYNGRMDKKSTGIGLYLCKQIADNLGILIDVSSEVGKGTKFQIYLNSAENEL